MLVEDLNRLKAAVVGSLRSGWDVLFPSVWLSKEVKRMVYIMFRRTSLHIYPFPRPVPFIVSFVSVAIGSSADRVVYLDCKASKWHPLSSPLSPFPKHCMPCWVRLTNTTWHGTAADPFEKQMIPICVVSGGEWEKERPINSPPPNRVPNHSLSLFFLFCFPR